MTAFRTYIAKTITASGIAAGALLALGATTAEAAPAPVAVASQSSTTSAAGQGPEFWAGKVNLTFVNNTDLTLHHKADAQSPARVIAPGERVYLPGTSTNSRSFDAGTADGGAYVRVLAYNHAIGTPFAQAALTVGGQSAEGKEHQGVDEFDRIAALGNLEVTSFRHGDNDGKNFTMTLTKSGAAATTVDNTASGRNTYVYTNGVMTPVHKGAQAPAGLLDRGQDSRVSILTGGVTTDLHVRWHGPQATFSGLGTSVSLANGESVRIGAVTITRADTSSGNTTAYTYSIR